MPTLTQFFQKWVELPNEKVVGVHYLELKSSSDSFTVPPLDSDTASASTAILLQRVAGADQSGITATDDATTYDASSPTRTVTIDGGSAGDKVVVTTLHKKSLVFPVGAA